MIHNSWKNIYKRLVWIGLLIGILCSCNIGIRAKALMSAKLNVAVEVHEKANDNSPIAVDLLVVYDKSLMKRLLSMSSKEWFADRAQIRRDYLQSTGFDCWGWEWIPGQIVTTQSLPLEPKAVGGLIFAGYSTPGNHRVSIDPFTSITISLLEKDFNIKPR